MELLKTGSTGALVELLQLALNRAGFGRLDTDGIFGAKTRAAVLRFQAYNGLAADGIVGTETRTALMPWYTGFFTHTVRRDDTLYKLAREYGSSIEAIARANPDEDAMRLRIGSTLVIPLPFEVVPTDISWSSALVGYCVRGLAARYPFIRVGEMGRSVMQRPLWYISVGSGSKTVLYNASHHANEWITTPVLMRFTEQLLQAYSEGGSIFGEGAAALLDSARLYIVPAVNPDGIDLVTGALSSGDFFSSAQRIAAAYPQYPFPSGWKANIRGTDLNLQYPAEWETARKNKYALGITGPAPADYVGSSPLSAPESRALYDFTLAVSPSLTLAYHTQGEVIYWRFLDYEPPRSRELADTFAAVSGYAVEDAPYASGFAGYKDWFIQSYDRPGYTVEAGRGTNPLPISDFDKIYIQNVGILVKGITAGR